MVLGTQDTQELLDSILEGKAPLGSLVGMRYWGTFGETETAGVITWVTKHAGVLAFNYQIGTPHVSYALNVGARFEEPGRFRSTLSTAFVLDRVPQ